MRRVNREKVSWWGHHCQVGRPGLVGPSPLPPLWLEVGILGMAKDALGLPRVGRPTWPLGH